MKKITKQQKETRSIKIGQRTFPAIGRMLKELAGHGKRSIPREVERIIEKEHQAVFGHESSPSS